MNMHNHKKAVTVEGNAPQCAYKVMKTKPWANCPDCGGYADAGHPGTPRCRNYRLPQARALGFSSVAQMDEHDAWLRKNGTHEFKKWLERFEPSGTPTPPVKKACLDPAKGFDPVSLAGEAQMPMCDAHAGWWNDAHPFGPAAVPTTAPH